MVQPENVDATHHSPSLALHCRQKYSSGKKMLKTTYDT